MMTPVYSKHRAAPALWLWVLLLPLVAGCGAKFLYNKLDWLIPWYIDDYVSLNENQELLLDERLKPYLAAHRREQLPRYAAFFEQVAKASEDGLDELELQQLFDQTEQFGSELFASIGPSFHAVFRQLSDAQIAEIRSKLEEKNAELYEKYVEREANYQRASRADDMQNFLQRWLGDLSDRQKAMIDAWSQQYQLMGPEFMQTRQLWQSRFFAVLELRQDVEAFEPALNELFGERYLRRSPEHQEKYEYNEKLLRQLYFDIDKTLDSVQRFSLLDELRDYAEDFRELSQQSN